MIKIKLSRHNNRLKIKKSFNDKWIIKSTPPFKSTIKNDNNKNKDNNQKFRLFKGENDVSGAPINKDINQFPNPPIMIGIIKKKIIIKAWFVTITLYKL